MFKQISLAGTILVALAVSQARADVVVNYQFSSNAAMTLSDGTTEAISGGFVWDASTGTPVSDNITVTGADLTLSLSATEGVFPIFWVANNAGINGQTFYDTTPSYGSTGFELQFENSLALGENDPLDVIAGPPNFYPGIWVSGSWIEATSFTGSADVVPAPEPASMALLSVGMAGLGFVRRRRANRHSV